jgi:hypothetical protein
LVAQEAGAAIPSSGAPSPVGAAAPGSAGPDESAGMGRTTEGSGRLAPPPDASDVIVAAEPAVPSEPSLPDCSGNATDSLVPGESGTPKLRSSMLQPARLETSAQVAKRAATQACREELESTRLYITHDAKRDGPSK